MLLGQNIRYIRKKLRQSQEEFAEHFDVTRTMIGYYENNKARPDIEFLLQLEQISGYSFKEICTENLHESVQKTGNADLTSSFVQEDRPEYKTKVDERIDWIEDFLGKKHDDYKPFK